jgi:hypothetical protein
MPQVGFPTGWQIIGFGKLAIHLTTSDAVFIGDHQSVGVAVNPVGPLT